MIRISLLETPFREFDVDATPIVGVWEDTPMKISVAFHGTHEAAPDVRVVLDRADAEYLGRALLAHATLEAQQ